MKRKASNKKTTSLPTKRKGTTANRPAKKAKKEEEYEVERVLASRTWRGVTQYSIKWVGYPESEATWEGEANLNCPQLIREFTSSQGNASTSKNGRSTAKKAKSGKAEEEDEKEYEVEKVLAVRDRRGNKEYSIKWKGYPITEATWEKESNLNCAKLIAEFMLSQKNASKKSVTTKGKKKRGRPTKKTNEKKEEKDFEVEKILDCRVSRGKTQYLVKWVGYPEKEATWEAEHSLNCQELLDEFSSKQEDDDKTDEENIPEEQEVESESEGNNAL